MNKDRRERLVQKFFADCAEAELVPNRENMFYWLWFTCPAGERADIGKLIKRDDRFRGDE